MYLELCTISWCPIVEDKQRLITLNSLGSCCSYKGIHAICLNMIHSLALVLFCNNNSSISMILAIIMIITLTLLLLMHALRQTTDWLIQVIFNIQCDHSLFVPQIWLQLKFDAACMYNISPEIIQCSDNHWSCLGGRHRQLVSEAFLSNMDHFPWWREAVVHCYTAPCNVWNLSFCCGLPSDHFNCLACVISQIRLTLHQTNAYMQHAVLYLPYCSFTPIVSL